MINFSGDVVLKEAGPVFELVLEFAGLGGRTFQEKEACPQHTEVQPFRCDFIRAAPVDQCTARMQTEAS